MANIVRTTDLKKHYRMGQSVVRALDGVSLSVAEGEFIGLLGTSGSGKSTLLNLIAGLDVPTSGTLEIYGQRLSAMSREELSVHRRTNVGIIFQSFNLISTMAAIENVTLAMMFAAVPRAERNERGRRLLELVGLGGRQMHKPAELSGGEQQRVAIARAMANNPKVLLADEPTGNLDSRTAREILDLLGQLNSEQGRTVIMVTHDPVLAALHVKRTVTLVDGRIDSEAAS